MYFFVYILLTVHSAGPGELEGETARCLKSQEHKPSGEDPRQTNAELHVTRLVRMEKKTQMRNVL
jgi:hypothetical protein